MAKIDVEKLLRRSFSKAELDFLSHYEEFQALRAQTQTAADYDILSAQAFRLLEKFDTQANEKRRWSWESR